MAINELYSGTTTLVIGTETALNTVTPSTTPGVYQLVVDTALMVAGDVLEIRIKEKALSGGVQRVIMLSTLANTQGADNSIYFSPGIILMNGWDMTLKQTAGTGRSFPWSIRQVG